LIKIKKNDKITQKIQKKVINLNSNENKLMANAFLRLLLELIKNYLSNPSQASNINETFQLNPLKQPIHFFFFAASKQHKSNRV
jgi:translation elongation factor EF-G